jgi:hypothetical protein
VNAHEAAAIITFNLADFPPEILASHDIVALHPDAFLTSQLELAPTTFCAAAKRQRDSLKKPPLTIEQYLDSLARQGIPQTAAALRQLAELI